jgi:ribonuclease HI
MEKITIFTDGSSRGNPGPGGYGAIIINEIDDHVWELGGFESNTTNNRMELMATIESLKRCKDSEGKIEIHTDSNYVINGITKWVQGWEAGNWMTKAKMAVLNKDLWQALLKESEGKKINWKHVRGHAGVAGNERADEIATEFADRKKPKLYRGSIEGYRKDILDLSASKTSKTKSGGRKGTAYSYISEVDGTIVRHKTWAECEERVRGRKARFKKALSAEEEKRIINEFGKY